MMSLGMSEILRGSEETDLSLEGESTTGDRVEFILVDLLLTQRCRGDWNANSSQLFPSILDRSARNQAHALVYAVWMKAVAARAVEER